MSSVVMKKTNLKTGSSEVFYLYPDIEVICLMEAIYGLPAQKIIEEYNKRVQNDESRHFTLTSEMGVEYLFEEVEA